MKAWSSKLLVTYPATLVALALPAPAGAQNYAPAESVTVVAGAEYKRGGLYRTFFGRHYRTLWTTPIRVPVLRLALYAGGLKPTERGGGQQTTSLRLEDATGREYQFRSVDKDPSSILPEELRGTVADDIVQDQISAGHPVGATLVAPILAAAGVLHMPPTLVVMADDPALGEFQAEFKGILGTIEERPRDLPGGGTSIPGATEIEGTEDLLDKIDENPLVPVDARAFLTARLVDVLMGDWDRHADQWRWAKVKGERGEHWRPIPRDRDQVFARYDGFLLGQARKVAPQLTNFRAKYPDITGAVWNGRDLDRRFLTSLERPVWDSIAAALEASITDAVIAAAVARLVPEYQPLDGERLERTLRVRRDGIREMAGKYYDLLAGTVDVHASDEADDATVVRGPDGTTVTLAHQGTEYFRRHFNRETGEIRIYLHSGNDRFAAEGDGQSPRIRVIGGGDDDQFTVATGGVHLYDEKGNNRAEGGGINTKPWDWHPDSANPAQLPPRDWGKKTFLMLTGYFATDLGAVIDYGGFTNWYGFRSVPYATRLDYRLQYSTARQSFRFTGGFTNKFAQSSGFWQLNLLASGIETLRWYGPGNETAQVGSRSFYKVSQTQLGAGLRFGAGFGKRNTVSVGPEVRWSSTGLDEGANQSRFIAIDRPYGTGSFTMAGVSGEARLEGRDHPGFASKGGYLAVKAAGFPKALDLESAFGRVEAEGSWALAPQGSWRPSLNLFAGGIKTFGRAPFFESAMIGGQRTLRGYNPDRFAGDAAVFGSAEVRLPLSRIRIVVPGQQGVFAFYDVGRVYLEGETSDELHSAIGGGIWLSFLGREQVAFVGAAKPTKDKEGTRILAGFGFPF